jgi:S-formylglutathione hydrolase FrmB
LYPYGDLNFAHRQLELKSDFRQVIMRNLRATLLLLTLPVIVPSILLAKSQEETKARFEISFPKTLKSEPVTGRVFVAITRDQYPEPRMQAGYLSGAPFFGVDVSALSPGKPVEITRSADGFPISSLASLPAGDYWVQAFLSVYSEFRRSDGHTLWLHDDQWEGQQPLSSPGTLVSEPQRVHLDVSSGFRVRLELTRALPPVTVPSDDEYVKFEKIQSKLLTAFWGRPIYLGAVVLLPRGYAQHPEVHYPGIWFQDHFKLQPAFGFTRDPAKPETEEERIRRIEVTDAKGTPAEFTQAWLSDSFPRMIAINILHPTPYYDDSYAVNSANNGPYWDAIHTELMPYIEGKYRLIARSYARVTTGASTGGWEALALQIYHPDVFGGTWSFCPDPVDFHRYEIINLYEDKNAFTIARSDWLDQERPSERMPDGQTNFTVRQETQLNTALGTRLKGSGDFANWQAVWGPTAPDGYPKPIWDERTGVIDHEVAEYWRAHDFDLTDYLKRNWTRVGPTLAGQIHIYNPDMDRFLLNLAVYRLEDFFRTAAPAAKATLVDGRPLKTHDWHPMSDADLVRQMAKHIAAHAPADDPVSAWNY